MNHHDIGDKMPINCINNRILEISYLRIQGQLRTLHYSFYLKITVFVNSTLFF